MIKRIRYIDGNIMCYEESYYKKSIIPFLNKEIVESGKHYGALSYYINQVLSKQELTKDSKWVDKVRDMMSKDHRLTNQNVVIEYNK